MCNCYCVNYTVQSRCVTVIVLIIQYSHGVLLLLCVSHTVQSRCVTVIVLIIQYSHGVQLLLCVNYSVQSRFLIGSESIVGRKSTVIINIRKFLH